MEITVTKTCLDVLKQLGNAFSSAMEADGKGTAKNVAPYVLKNETGLAIVLNLSHSHFKVSQFQKYKSEVVDHGTSPNRVSFQVFDDGSTITNEMRDSYMEVILESGASVELAPKTKVTQIPLLDQLKSESINEREDNKFIISVMPSK